MNSNLPPERLQLGAPRTLPQRAELCRRRYSVGRHAEVRLRLGRSWSPDVLAEHHLQVTVY
jgi:hypothetical protein